MPKAIIFDCFGVLATEAWTPFKAKYFAHDPELFKRVSDISRQADKGLMSRDAAVQETSKLAGISPAEFRQAIGSNVPDEDLFAYLHELKLNYKLGLLSNISDNYLHHIFTPEHLDLFDVIALSFESGFIKPQMQAFKLMAERLGVKPEESVMVDDQESNVAGAREAGMEAILYENATQLRRELDKLLKP
jgi:HAD superfamily hydrolase (TIGR01509 family)